MSSYLLRENTKHHYTHYNEKDTLLSQFLHNWSLGRIYISCSSLKTSTLSQLFMIIAFIVR